MASKNYEKKIILNKGGLESLRDVILILINFMVAKSESDEENIEYLELRLKDPELFSMSEKELRLRWVTISQKNILKKKEK